MKNKILSNGLNSFVIKNPASDVVSIQVWVSCGSVNETESEYGVSHFIEHLLFKGTEKHAVGEIAQVIESLGGDLNAFTSKEYTCYYITIPSLHLEEGLLTLKDLVFCPSFIQEEIDSEREVIVEEIRRYQDIPGSVASENFFEVHFKGHPYSRPIIGYEEIIRNISREKIIDYYSRFYTPSNCLLVVCGNVNDTDKTFIKIKSIFEDIKDRKINKTKINVVGIKTDQVCKVHNMDINELSLVFGFPIPELTHEDVPALDILGLILGQGDSSRLVKLLRVEKGSVTSVGSYAYTPRYGGTFNVSFTFDGTTKNPAKRIGDVISDISKEIKRVKNDISVNEIEKAKTILLSDKVYEREKVEGLASKVGHMVCVTGGLDFEKTYFDRLRKISVSNIINVLDKYIDISKVSLSAVLPNECKIEDKKLLDIFNQNFVTKEQKHEKTKSHDDYNSSRASVVDSITEDADYNFEGKITVEAPEILIHKSGAKIISRKINSTPLVSMKILMPGGVLFENESNQGISNLLARTITLGADELSFADIADIIDSTASSLSAFSGRNSVGISLDFMKPFFTEMLDLTSKIILKPKFKQDYFDTEKKVIEDEIKSAQDNLAQYSRQLLLKTMYKEHPYRFEISGTIDTVKKLTRDDVISFYKKLLNPKKLIFSVTGDFNKSELLNWVDDLIAKINSTCPELLLPEEEPEQTENRITRFKKESKQAHIFIAYKTCGLRSADKYPLGLIDSVLGGQSGRLFMELRDKQSLAYTVAPVELYGPGTGYFGAYIASENSKVDKAIEEIRKQMKKLVEEGISEKELLRAKNFLIGRNAIAMQSFSEQAITMGFDEMFGDGYSTMLTYSKNILSLTTEDVQNVAKKYFKEGKENLSIVSN